MNALVTAIVTLLSSLLPAITSGSAASSVIDQIIVTLINIIPLIAQVVPALLSEIQNIVAALKGSPLTEAQFQSLQTAEAALDAAFEAAATAAGDPAPGS